MSVIRPGDLVVVTGAHCDKSTHWLGQVFTVGQVGTCQTAACAKCRAAFGPVNYVTEGMTEHYYNSAWVKRIPPIDELERDQIVEELTA
jgi:hypothetical protein